MAKFKDKTGHDWSVELDVLKIEEVQDDHGIRLTDLERDPLLKIRTDPAVIYSVMLVLCRDERERLGLSREDFLKRMPVPQDAMLEALSEAIINFFPSGRHSHVREVLAMMDVMSLKSDEIATSKMSMIMRHPLATEMMEREAEIVFNEAIQKISEKRLT